MDTGTVTALSSVLSAASLRDWLAQHYDLPEPLGCRLVSLSLNDTYEVHAGAARAYLRVYRHAWRTREEIDAELAIVHDLSSDGLPVAQPVATSLSDYVVPIEAAEGQRYAVLWQPAEGEDARDLTTQQARAYGRLAARLHLACDARGRRDNRFDLDQRHLLDEPLAVIRPFFAGRDADLARLDEIAERVRGVLGALPRGTPDFGLCHGDLHPGNARFGSGALPAIFDFDCCGYGWRAYDLAVFVWNMLGERRAKRWRADRWRAFQRGYAEVRPLPADLPATTSAFLAARQLWLTGLDCAGKSGFPPQCIPPDYLQRVIGWIESWELEYGPIGTG